MLADASRLLAEPARRSHCRSTNALKYGRDKPIEIDVAPDGEHALLRVVDHGIGIAATEQARIFDRFERAVQGRDFVGFGLGLWIARQIVETSGGTIDVASAPGTGASFTVRLPREARIG